MAWLWVVLVVVVLGLTAAVAVGRGGAMARAYPDRRDVRLPADRSLSADDLSDVEFSVVLRGYRMDEVDEVIRRLVHELAERDARLGRLGGADPAEGFGHRAATSPSAALPGAPPSDLRPPGHRAAGDALVGAERDGWHPAEPSYPTLPPPPPLPGEESGRHAGAGEP
jgi:DivIVA domain-containing protein